MPLNIFGLRPELLQGIQALGYAAPTPVQTQDLKRGAEVVVATPGRLLDHIRSGTFNLQSVRRRSIPSR